MELSEYVAALRKQWLLIVAFCILGGMAGLTLASLTTPSYRATSSIFVTADRGETTGELVQGSTYTQNLVTSLVQLVQKPVVIDPVIEDLGLEMSSTALARSISAENPLNTVIIDITVVDSSPTLAAEIANGVAASLSRAAADMGPASAGTTPTINMDVVAEAQSATTPFAPNTRLMVATGALAGLALGVVIALARQLLDTRIRNSADIERISDVPVLGSVPRNRRSKTGNLVVRSEPHGHGAEAFRLLATNLQFLNPDSRIKSVVVSSALPAEGKSTTAINLALAVAERDLRVLLVDADLRRPSVGEYTGIEGSAGLTTVLSGSSSLQDVIETWGDVDVLPSGSIPPNPNQILNSHTMAELMQQLAGLYDFIVVDSPPLLLVADALPLARLTDGALMVARHRKTRRGQLARALGNLDGVGATTVGIVLSGTQPERRRTYYREAVSVAPAREDQQATGEVVTPQPSPETGRRTSALRPRTVEPPA